MKKLVEINLNNLVNPGKTDWISGRAFGENEAVNNKLLELIKEDIQIVLVIDKNIVKAINDSFIKGFFSAVFKELKSKEKVKSFFKIEADPYFVQLFEKNWTILDALYENIPYSTGS